LRHLTPVSLVQAGIVQDTKTRTAALNWSFPLPSTMYPTPEMLALDWVGAHNAILMQTSQMHKAFCGRREVRAQCSLI
jgi:hypothetical protein